MNLPQRLFLAFSAAILVTVVLFVVLSDYTARGALEQALADRAAEVRSAYQVALSATESSAVQLASFIANDVQTEATMHRAQEALAFDALGGRDQQDMSGAWISDVRYVWLQEIQPRWRVLQQRYDASELGFYLTRPDSIRNFLRVHRAQVFGDKIENPQHPVFLAFLGERPLGGYAFDRDGLSLRGVAPVFVFDAAGEEEQLIGLVEVGITLEPVLSVLHTHLGVQSAVLLGAQEVDTTVDADVITRQLVALPAMRCFYAHATGADAVALLAAVESCKAVADEAPAMRTIAGQRFAQTSVALAGVGSAPPIGRVVLWFDAESAVARYEHALVVTIVYALLGFILLEVLLYALVRWGVRVFDNELRRRTREIRQLNRKLARIATVDSLTGLFTRRHFLQRLQQELERARRGGHAVSLLLIDLDHFKHVNDTYGHQMGDAVLRRLGNYLREQVRAIDVAGRYGGEELCILLPETPVTAAAQIAERLRQEIEALSFETEDGQAFAVTASFGVAQWREHTTAEVLISEADKALYASKESGRNRVSIYRPPVLA